MKNLLVVRGAGDLASGIIAKFHNCGFKVLALESEQPTAIRRLVCFSEAVWNEEVTIEDIKAVYAENEEDICRHLDEGKVVVTRDPQCELITRLKPEVIVDAIIAKVNIDTKISMAPIVVGVGPGHVVGIHCHAAVESKRGHDLGRVYYEGTPKANTGIPGEIGGYTKERVCYAPHEGYLEVLKDITQTVMAGEVIAKIGDVEVKSSISGMVRGMLRHGTKVGIGTKMADIDPRVDQLNNCYSISDKARCIAGGALEAVLYLRRLSL
jgi:xanthine dehydrogenase accessory factor